MPTKALLVAGVILAFTGGVATAQTARPDAPTGVGDVKWGATLAELQTIRPNARCHVEYDKRSPFLEKDAGKETYDLERGLLIVPVVFRATCFDLFQEGEVTFLLEGNPPRFHMAYITYQDQDYPALQETFVTLYGPPNERVTQARPWRWWWSAAPSYEPERLIWRRPKATVTLDSAGYVVLGRSSTRPTMVIRAVDLPK